MGKRKSKAATQKTMTRLYMNLPKGPWEDINLPIFTFPKYQYVYVARCDLGKALKDPQMTLSDFQRIFRSCDGIKDSQWSKFMIEEDKLPYPLDTDHKPAHQQEGWAGAHIYTLVSLGGLAAILAGYAGAKQKLKVLFPSVPSEYLRQVARACLDKHNELTGQSIRLEQLEALAHQEPKGKKEVRRTINLDKVDQKKKKPVAVKREKKAAKGRGKSILFRRTSKTDQYAKRKLNQELKELEEKKRKLNEEIIELRALHAGYTKLTEDLASGIVEKIPFTIAKDTSEAKAEAGTYVIEIDMEGVARRKTLYVEDPFAGLNFQETI